MDSNAFAKIAPRFEQQILAPAIELHNNMQNSVRQYRLIEPNVSSELSPQMKLEHWDLKDADTWGPVKRKNRVGAALHCLHPSLVRLGVAGASNLTLVKPVVVITSPGRKLNANSDSKNGQTSVDKPATSPEFVSNQVMKSSIENEDIDGYSSSLSEDESPRSLNGGSDFRLKSNQRQFSEEGVQRSGVFRAEISQSPSREEEQFGSRYLERRSTAAAAYNYPQNTKTRRSPLREDEHDGPRAGGVERSPIPLRTGSFVPDEKYSFSNHCRDGPASRPRRARSVDEGDTCLGTLPRRSKTYDQVKSMSGLWKATDDA